MINIQPLDLGHRENFFAAATFCTNQRAHEALDIVFDSLQYTDLSSIGNLRALGFDAPTGAAIHTLYKCSHSGGGVATTDQGCVIGLAAYEIKKAGTLGISSHPEDFVAHLRLLVLSKTLDVRESTRQLLIGVADLLHIKAGQQRIPRIAFELNRYTSLIPRVLAKERVERLDTVEGLEVFNTATPPIITLGTNGIYLQLGVLRPGEFRKAFDPIGIKYG